MSIAGEHVCSQIVEQINVRVERSQNRVLAKAVDMELSFSDSWVDSHDKLPLG